jgi:hypothetical protein
VFNLKKVIQIIPYMIISKVKILKEKSEGSILLFKNASGNAEKNCEKKVYIVLVN